MSVDEDFSYDDYDEVASIASDNESGSVNGEYDTMYHEWIPVQSRSDANVSIYEYNIMSSQQQTYYDSPERFVHDLTEMISRTGADAFNIKALVRDIETHDEVALRMRFNIDDMDELAQHIRNSTANRYNKSDGTGSDNVSGKLVLWNLGWVQLIANGAVDDVVTTIVGSSTLFPGYITKIINSESHGILYNDNDCIFICLNEITGCRFKPSMLRESIFSGDPQHELRRIDVMKMAHIKYISRIYNCCVAIHDVMTDTKMITSKDKSLQLIRLVKMGTAIGVVECSADVNKLKHVSNDGRIGHAYYDIETISNATTTEPWGFTFIWEDGTTDVLIESDLTILSSSVCNIVNSHIRESQCNIIYLHAWNGGRFDHRLLMSTLSRIVKVGFIINNTSQDILTVDLNIHNKKIILRDPCKMFPGTLHEVGEIFELDHNKLRLDHGAIETAYLCGHLQQYLDDHRTDIVEYMIRDVNVLRDVTQRIMNMYIDSNINYNASLSRNMASYLGWKNSLDSQQLKYIKQLSYSSGDMIIFSHRSVTIDEVKDNAIAGRCQAFKGEYDNCIMFDFKSMYPSVCVSQDYPAGELVTTLEYIPGICALYEVEITRQNYPHVIPYRQSRKHPYDWECSKIFRKIITNVDVECLVESNAEFIILGGVYWRSSEMYFSSYMRTMLNNRQVTYENTALSQHYKAMANTLTGAMFQELKREYIRIFEGRDEYATYNKMYSKYVKVVFVHEYDNGQLMVFYSPLHMENVEDAAQQRRACKDGLSSKPVILTMFIYAYARAKLWRTWRRIENCKLGRIIYCDTDSLLVVKYADIINALSDIIGTETGELLVELDNAESVIIKAKMYALRVNNTSSNITSTTDTSQLLATRIRCKGISDKSICLIYDNQNDAMEIVNYTNMHVDNIQPRDSQWHRSRCLYDYYNSQNQDENRMTYDMMLRILRGGVMINISWYFSRDGSIITKKYVVSMIQ
jgi:hypothetical protein